MRTRKFTLIHLLVVIVVVATLVAVGMAATKKVSVNGTIAQWQTECTGSGKVMMTHQPMDMSDVSVVYPLGTLAGEHVTPIDHLYFYPKDMKNKDAAPVYAMADGYIVHHEDNPGRTRIVVQANCDTFYYYDLLTSLDPELKKKVSAPTLSMHVPVKSGQIIGRVGAQSLDTAIYDAKLTLPGFAVPEHYKSEFWKIHTADFFSYFPEALSKDMLALNPRTAEPRSGKIDYDQPGKLVGTWFKEGTIGYEGANGDSGFTDDKGTIAPYWTGHFSIAPDAFDPSRTAISFGDYQGKATQFALAEGSTDPAQVTVSSGVIAYELFQAKNHPVGQVQEQPGAMLDTRKPEVLGVVLLQVTGPTSMKMETFPGKKLADVRAFTAAAATYNR